MCHVRLFEDDRFGRELVEVWRVHLFTSVARDCVGSLLVRQEKDQIRLPRCSHAFQVGTKSAVTALCNYLGSHRSRRYRRMPVD